MTPAPLTGRLGTPGGPPFSFRRPFGEPRAQGRGHAVSPGKAGVRLRGLHVGEVRPPPHEPAGNHVEQLARLIERRYALLEEDA